MPKIQQADAPMETKPRVDDKNQNKKPYVFFSHLYFINSPFYCSSTSSSEKSSTYLELDKCPSSKIDYTQIVNSNKKTSKPKSNPPKERENSSDFIDDPDVPPLI